MGKMQVKNYEPICLNDGQYYSINKYPHLAADLSERTDILTLIADKSFKLDFTGLILHDDQPVVVFPKEYPVPEDPDERIKAAALLVNVIIQYRNDPTVPESEKPLLTGDKNSEARIVTALSLLDAYRSTGLMYRHREEEGKFGKGITLWGETVCRANPIISDTEIIYDRPIRRIRRKDYKQPVTLIHGYVINECQKMWSWIEGRKPDLLLDFYRMPYTYNEAIYQLKRELTVTYNQTEIRTIKLLITYLKGRSEKEALGICLVGTHNYEYVWESICGYIFDSRYRELKDIIPQPTWKDVPWVLSQRPDVISTDTDTLYVIDAKYRSYERDTIGWYDAAKQYLYAYTVRENLLSPKYRTMLPNIKKVGNAFVFPGKEEGIKYLGQLSFDEIESLGIIYAFAVGQKQAMQMYAYKTTYISGNPYLKELRNVIDNNNAAC